MSPVVVRNPKQLHLPMMRACFEETARRAENENDCFLLYGVADDAINHRCASISCCVSAVLPNFPSMYFSGFCWNFFWYLSEQNTYVSP
jgi:hypothetical protein